MEKRTASKKKNGIPRRNVHAPEIAPTLEERVIAKFPIVGELKRLAKKVPAEAWDTLPRDLTSDLDHYLYGSGQ